LLGTTGAVLVDELEELLEEGEVEEAGACEVVFVVEAQPARSTAATASTAMSLRVFMVLGRRS
jgi:hypothetical protein